MGLVVLIVSAPFLVPVVIICFIIALVSGKKQGYSGRYYIVDEYDAWDVYGDYDDSFASHDFTSHEVEHDDFFGTDLLCGGLPYGDGELYMEDDCAFFDGGGEDYL